MSVGFTQTETDTATAIVDGVTQILMISSLGPGNTAFAQGADLKKTIQMKSFAQGMTKIVVSTANKNHALLGEHTITPSMLR